MKTSRAIAFGIAATAMFAVGALAQQSHHGTVVQVEQAKGTITVTEALAGTTGSSSGATAHEYKLQDGLLFNALKVGDVVTFTVEEKGGVKTITNLQEK
jgi:Cu/Ag efflux protein CusF